MECLTTRAMRRETKAARREGGGDDLKDAFDDFLSALLEAFKRRQRRAARRDRAEALRRRGDRGEGRPHLRCARPAEAHARPARAEGAAAGDRRRARAVRRRASTRRRSTPMSARGEMSGLKRLEAKAVSTVTTPDGGYLVPPETEAEIGRRLGVVSPIRAIAGVRTVSSNVYRKPFATTGFETGWVGETDARDGDRHADPGRARISGDGALRHAGGDLRRSSTMPRSTSTSGSPSEVEMAFADAGERRLRQRRRRQEADAASSTTPRSPRRAGCGRRSATVVDRRLR